MDRREFLKIAGITGAGMAATGCAEKPTNELLPYLIPDEEIVPGRATWYATVCRECPVGCGLHVRVREGRAVKLEGSPDHPINRGALCARGQAGTQGLYNPDRIQGPMKREGQSFTSISWEEAETILADRLGEVRAAGQADRITFLTGHQTGSLDRLISRFLEAFGSDRHVRYEPFAFEPIREANRLTFGRAAIPLYDLEGAQFLLSFGADFLETWVSPLLYSRLYSQMAGFREGKKGTFVHIEARQSLTASNADEWLAPRPGTEGELALALARLVVEEDLGVDLPEAERRRLRGLLGPYTPEAVAEVTGLSPERIQRLARAFASSRPSVAVGGGVASTTTGATRTQVAINLLNYAAGNIGETVRFGPEAGFGELAAFRDMERLIEQLQAGEVPLLLVHEANPFFTLPPSARFAEAMEAVPFVVSFSRDLDETTARADLILPDHHPLESWGDHISEEGARGLMQPVMQPVFNTRSLGDVLLAVAHRHEAVAGRLPWPSLYQFLREEWRDLHRAVQPGVPFEAFWEESLRRGGLFRSVRPRRVRLASGLTALPDGRPSLDGPPEGLALISYPSSVMYDGRGANKPWLQELPDPVTKIAWQTWVELHPRTAKRLGVMEGDVVEIESTVGRIQALAYLTPGIREDVAAIPMGQGHTAYGRYAKDRGANPLALLPVALDAPSGALARLSTRVTVRPTGRRQRLARSQRTEDQGRREIARALPLSAAVAAEAAPKERLDLVEAAKDADPDSPYRWGMAIDLSACMGCGACIAACYAENNVPVVGEEQFIKGREMAWIRVNRFVEEKEHGPEVVHQPMLCQHCGNAPCEPVCPVYATYHNPEGLNVQVYNRCVGTRYCSNNCPYKVRRFNYFSYEWPEPLHLLLNPDVTVREKGVMEKCTFCVQRINTAKRDAKADDRQVRDGEVVPACAQACPAHAIVFGNLRDQDSEVTRLSRNARGYHVLDELNTRSAITYLKEVRLDRLPSEGRGEA